MNRYKCANEINYNHISDNYKKECVNNYYMYLQMYVG